MSKLENLYRRSSIVENHIRIGKDCIRTCKDIARYCESPIEVQLGTALFLEMSLHVGFETLEVVLPVDEASANRLFVLMPQYPWKNYRIDWCIKISRLKQPYFFIECDGHDFHERTKEQAERDRRKDRDIQAAGIPILRFTGREIFRNHREVVAQIFNFMTTRINQEDGR